MPNFVDQIVVTIKRGKSDDLPGAFERAGFVFEKARGLAISMTPEEQVESFGWPSDLVHEKIYKEDIQRLRKELLAFCEKFPDHVHVPFAVEALGHMNDPSLKPFFVATLRAHLDGNYEAMSSAMIALDELGEEIFSDNVDYSEMDVEDYRGVAKAYLGRIKGH